MSADIKHRFEAILASGKDSALLRFSLGSAYLQEDNPVVAAAHFERALLLDPHYSAAWKLLGKACADNGDIGRAREAYSKGIVCAETAGDKQAAKEMTIFLRRLERVRS
jgi:predicted Zn-dependent protease